jgi:hypothetical protein
MDNINAIELSEEQLDTVTGGSQTNVSGNANIAGSEQVNAVVGSALVLSPVGGSNLAQTNVTGQSNYKNTTTGLWW